MDGMTALSAPKNNIRRSVQHVNAHKPQTATTLMRRAVKAPAPSFKSTVQTATPIQAPAPAAAAQVKPKLSSSSIDPQRSQRAQSALRSQAVQHFKKSPAAASMNGFVASTAFQPRPAATPLAAPVAPAATQAFKPAAQPKPFQQVQARPQQGTAFRSQRSTAAFAAARRAPSPSVASVPAMQAAPAQDDQSQAVHDIFESALANATSHNEAAPQENPFKATKRKAKKSRQVLGIVSSVAVFLLLAGFIGYQNKANIQYQMASARAGFAASIPGYKPDGFNLGKLQYATGTIAATYQNKQSNSSIDITQKKSNWDSQTLLENFVASASGSYQGYDANGRTVYVYGDNNATWVNGGVWYQLHANGNVDAKQLVKIAANM